MRKAKLILSLVLVLSSLVVAGASDARSTINQRPTPRPSGQSKAVDLVIALDTSGSMNGLIDSARQKLWEVVTLLAKAEPRPDLRVGLISYGGTSGYDSKQGWVRTESDLTSDLDAVYAKLFALTTSGGDEYVARAVTVATRELSWTQNQGALKIVFVAGNEAATQDPKITIDTALGGARQRGIYVNTIFCGTAGSGEASGWARVAELGRGRYAAIDHNRIVTIATPMDAEMARLSSELNQTYMAFGGEGGRRKAENQTAQDANAMSAGGAPLAASRAAAKASALYRADDWDLVGAVKAGKKDVAAMPAAELPPAMRALSTEERKALVDGKAKERARIQKRITELSRQRDAYIAAERKKAPASPHGFDEAVSGAVKSQAEASGFAF